MALESTSLRPGFLVSLKTTLVGNVSYTKNTIEHDHATEDGARLARWETERVIKDAEEHDQAIKIRTACRGAVTAVCAKSSFGLLCPEEKSQELDEAIATARRLADAFNAASNITRIGIYVMVGRVVPDDIEAVRAINSEISDLLTEMNEGLRNLDVKRIRDAANKAKGIGSMLSPVAADRVQEAINIARKSARGIVKAGESAAQEVDLQAIAKITDARVAFLDIGDHDQEEITVPEGTGRALDFDIKENAFEHTAPENE